jgi:hypothetical protein
MRFYPAHYRMKCGTGMRHASDGGNAPGIEQRSGSSRDNLLSRTGCDQTAAYRGDYFRILPGSSGGFTAVAYPTRYRSSGVMTFIVSGEGRVSRKISGQIRRRSRAISTFPVDGRTPVE